MKYLGWIVYCCLQICCTQLSAQVVKTAGKSMQPIVVNFSDSQQLDLHPELVAIDQHPIPSAEYGHKKRDLDIARKVFKQNHPNIFAQKNRGAAPNPIVVKGIQGNLANSVPNDNDIAVSNAGKVVSVVNSNMSVFDDTGKVLLNRKSLTTVFAAAGNFQWISDPRIIYDPNNDRFIMVCFSGSLSNESTILLAFSQTNDPVANWNVYTLNGNMFNDSTWSDYPIIAISDQDLFITFNQVKDNVSWTVGFKQSVIWQIQKYEGYAGTPLVYDLWSNLQYGGTNLRNICPAKNQTTAMGNEMHFLTVRNVASENDSIFITTITNSLASGQAQIQQKVVVSPVKYGFPPNVPQKNGQYLMTNDARVLAAIYENDVVHFGLNTLNPLYMNAGVMLGRIQQISSNNPLVSATIFSAPNQEFGYPSMTYIGTAATDHRVLYNISHCYTDSFPGTSVLYSNAGGNFSDIVSVKEGVSIINRLTDSVERWGDYTNIQKMYNNPRRAYLANSWGKASNMNCWIAVIDNGEAPLATTNWQTNVEANVYPNPMSDQRFTIAFTLPEAQKIKYELYDQQGNVLQTILYTQTKSGKNEFSISTGALLPATYILVLRGDKGYQFSEKIQITR